MPKDKTSSKGANIRSTSHGHSKSTIKKKGGKTTLSAKDGIIDGHDYTNAQFEEIEPTFEGQVAPGLPKPDTLALSRLTARTGPGRKYTGLGWRDLLAVSTAWDTRDWLSMGNIASMTRDFRTNDDCKFRVYFCPPGLLHVEMNDDDVWSIQNVVALLA